MTTFVFGALSIWASYQPKGKGCNSSVTDKETKIPSDKVICPKLHNCLSLWSF